MDTYLANTLTFHQLQARILFQIYQACLPRTEQSDTLPWLETIVRQLLCSVFITFDAIFDKWIPNLSYRSEFVSYQSS